MISSYMYQSILYARGGAITSNNENIPEDGLKLEFCFRGMKGWLNIDFFGWEMVG